MLLTIATTHQPATDLGYLLYKHPDRAQAFDLTFGRANVFYPEATEDRCEVAMLVEVDPVVLARGKAARKRSATLWPYVNDRPYVASSFLSVAIGEVFGSALSGKSRERPELVGEAIPLEIEVAALPCRGGEGLLRRLFEPLGYAVEATRLARDEEFEAWGPSPYYMVTLAGTVALSEALAHLCVLVPVLDDDKHYFVDRDEVEKLLRRGEGWLSGHPERETITRRYLKRRGALVRAALDGLGTTEAEEAEADAADEIALERGPGVHQQRLEWVRDELGRLGARSVLDLGCGEGKLVRMLLEEGRAQKVMGLDPSPRELERAERKLERAPLRERATLAQGSVVYLDERLQGWDAAALVEVIEHIDPWRLPALERAVFGHARPGSVIVTTPNVEYNALFDGLPAGKMRHGDHRFEWTRAEFEAWARRVAEAHGYTVRFAALGPVDEALGGLSQAAIFER